MDPGPLRTPTPWQLFAGFFKTGLSGFGGVMPHARRMLVEDRRWLTDAQFTELLSLGQTLPGPNIMNMSVVIGARFHGWRGSLLAASGLMLAPLIIVLLLANLYGHFQHSARLAHALACVAAAAAGLILATGARLAKTLPRRAWTYAILAAAFLAVFWLRLPLLGILLVLGPLGIACGWRDLHREEPGSSGEVKP